MDRTIPWSVQMARGMRRYLVILPLFLLLLASTILPVLIILGFQTRWYLSIPYAAAVVGILVIVARTDAGHDAPPWAEGIPAFFTAHAFLTVTGVAVVFFAVTAWFFPAAGNERAMTLYSLGGEALVLFLKYLSARSPRLHGRPLGIEVLADFLAAAAILPGAIAILF